MTQNSLQPVGSWLGESFGRLGGRVITLSMLFLFGVFAMLLSILLIYALGFVFVGFLQGWENLGRTIMSPRKLQFLLSESQGALAIINLLAAFVGLRIYCWILLASIHASVDSSLGFRAALRRGKERGYAFLMLVLLQQAILQVGVLLFILPGIVFAVLFGFAFWVFAREKAGVFQSLGESVRLVKGRFFGVLGRMLLLGLIGCVMMIIPIFGMLVGVSWFFLAWSLLYGDLRGPSQPKPQVIRPPRIPRRAAA